MNPTPRSQTVSTTTLAAMLLGVPPGQVAAVLGVTVYRPTPWTWVIAGGREMREQLLLPATDRFARQVYLGPCPGLAKDDRHQARLRHRDAIGARGGVPAVSAS
jgi:hypothetical protein